MVIRRKLVWTLAVVVCVAVSQQRASAQVRLPDPTLVIDGVPVSTTFGDFVTFPTGLLVELQDNYGFFPVSIFGDYASERGGAGVGGQDLVIYTQAGGIKNPDPDVPGGFLDDPIPAVTGGQNLSFTGTWGDVTPVTVSDVLSFLPAGQNIPVFAFDQNQTGNNPDLEIQGVVSVLTPGMVLVDSWSLDFMGGPVPVPGEIPINFVSTPEDPDFVVDSNLGSGIVDFWGYAPTMDLSAYPDDYVFIVDMSLGELDDGGEELFISGTIRTIPEAVSFTVWSGLAAVGFVGFRRRSLVG